MVILVSFSKSLRALKRIAEKIHEHIFLVDLVSGLTGIDAGITVISNKNFYILLEIGCMPTFYNNLVIYNKKFI